MAGHYINTIEDQRTGRPVNGATVLVYNDGATISGNSVTSGTLATIFSDDGVTTINQTTSPITTASNGFFEFYTNQTRVVIAVLFNGVGTEVYNDVDILGGTVSSDVTALSVRVDAVEAVTQDPLIVDLAGLDDPNADRIVFWDDSAGGLDWLTVGSGLSVSGTTLSAAGAGSGDITTSGLTMNTARILGRTTASSGAIEELTAGTGLTLSAGSLSVNQTAVKPTESIIIACSDETTALTTGTAKVTFRMPYAFTLSAVRASVTTAPTGAVLTVDINEAGVSILSTKLTIDATEKTSTTAATPAVISDTSLADDAEITIDIDTVGSTIAGAGLKVTLIGSRT